MKDHVLSEFRIFAKLVGEKDMVAEGEKHAACGKECRAKSKMPEEGSVGGCTHKAHHKEIEGKRDLNISAKVATALVVNNAQDNHYYKR